MELEILKEFLAVKIDQLQLSVNRLSNEKEDWQVMNESNQSLKSSLMDRLAELEQGQTRLRTELVFKGQRLDEVEELQREESAKIEQERQ